MSEVFFKMIWGGGWGKEYKSNSILDEVMETLGFLIRFSLLPICFKFSKIEEILKSKSFLLTETETLPI